MADPTDNSHLASVSRRARRVGAVPRRSGELHGAALLEAARDLVESGRFDDAPIAEIARRAGLSREGFYFHYTSKDELLAHLVTEILASSSQHWEQALDRHEWDRPSDILRTQVEGTSAMWAQYREIFRAAVETEPRSAVISAHWSARVHASADRLTELVVTSTRLEDLREAAEATRMLAALIWMIERNCYMHFVHGSEESDAALAARLTGIYARAVGVD